MKQNYSYPGWTKRAALSVAAFCVAATAAHAQTTVFATDFDGNQTVSGTASTTTTYASPNYANTYTSSTDRTADGPTAPLATQNGWTSNDAPGPIGHGVFAPSSTTQVNGGTTYVGGIGTFFASSQAGAVGAGVYAATAGTPVFAVPTQTSGGTVTVAHALTVGAGSPSVVLNLDYALVSTAGVAKDLFAFSLSSTAGANILSINFTPSTAATGQMNISTTSGTTATASAIASSLNTQYHLKLTLNAANSSFVALINGTSGGTQEVDGTFAGGLTNIGQIIASETLSAADKTLTNGGYTGASDNYLGFDNITVAVPEPSTYAMMALGLVGLAGLARQRRQA